MTDAVALRECCLCRVELSVGDPGAAVLLIEDEPGAALEMGQPVIFGGGIPDYDGPYEVTPGPEAQIFQTKDHAMRENLRINPIPNNYGLITYNGGVITVS